MQELPLVIFTLLIQGSVGITFFTAYTLMSSANRASPLDKKRYALPLMFIAAIAGGLGLIASTMHLGYPLNAFYSLTHFTTSWLSREIIFASLYLAVLGLAVLLALINKRISKPLLLLAALLGVIDVFCMSAIYTHASIATWMHFNTYVMFFGTLISLGAVICIWSLTLLRPKTSPIAIKEMVSVALKLLVVMTVIRLFDQSFYESYLDSVRVSEVITFPYQPLVAYEELTQFRWVAWGLLALGLISLIVSARVQPIHKVGLFLGGALMIAAEVLLRFSFFSIH